jgi:hypothetical protein
MVTVEAGAVTRMRTLTGGQVVEAAVMELPVSAALTSTLEDITLVELAVLV